MDRYIVPVIGAATGAGAHVLLYRCGEWDLQALSLIKAYMLLAITVITLESSHVLDQLMPLRSGWAQALILAHIAGVYTSILTYRAFLHHLHAFPGPVPARISNFYATYLNAKRLHMYTEVESLHRQYGDYVRLGRRPIHSERYTYITGPTELSITDPQAVVALYGPHAQVAKGPWYNILHPRISLQTERDRKVHARRRRVWDMGFSSKGSYS